MSTLLSAVAGVSDALAVGSRSPSRARASAVSPASTAVAA